MKKKRITINLSVATFISSFRIFKFYYCVYNIKFHVLKKLNNIFNHVLFAFCNEHSNQDFASDVS